MRKKSYEARFGWFHSNESKLDNIYDRLVKLRHNIATALGYPNFIKLGYDRMGRTDYGPKEVLNFRKQIIEHVVPVVTKLNNQKKKYLDLKHCIFMME